LAYNQSGRKIVTGFVRILDVQPSRLPKQGQHIIGEATDIECQIIAKDLRISALTKLRWDLVAKPWRKSGFQLVGKVTAEIEQPCVVTLAPVIEAVDETVDLRFLPGEHARTRKEQPTKNAPRLNDIAINDIQMDISADEDEPETWEGDTVDVMGFVIEHLALGINPYPRADGVGIHDDSPNDVAQPGAETSALARALLKWGEKRRD
jgi:Large ribosomal RNA subunit accumulation protein YceD